MLGFMNTYKAILQYDGTGRLGFQRQEGKQTIQGDLDLSLKQILQGDFTTRAASRTDKGVHAIGQVIKISAEDPHPLHADKLNSTLPAHIRCLDLTPCSREFIPSIDQHWKEYRYLFSETHGSRFIAHPPEALNIDDIQTCVAMLTGTNDFQNFWSIGGISNTTVREILHCNLTVISPQDFFQDTIFSAGELTSCWQFRIVGTGFLKHMVRHLVGALWAVGSGKLTTLEFAELLHGELRPQRPWKKADPEGLYLLKVSYEPDYI